MQLKVKLPFCLNRQECVVDIKYNDFEKATYDQYIIASICKNSTSKEEAISFIDDVTGQGSLNKFFKKILETTWSKKTEELDIILKSSLFPIVKIDRTNEYTYYPDFDISSFKGKTISIKGKASQISDDALLEKLQLNVENLISLNIIENEISNEKKYYDIFFDDNIIYVNIENHKVQIPVELFYKSIQYDIPDVSTYKGKIKEVASGNSWHLLNTNILNGLSQSKIYYLDDEENYCEILNEFIKKTEVVCMYGLHFYKQEKLEYNEVNKEYCEIAVNTLIEKKHINEFKTKALLEIISYCDDLTSQKVISYILTRKNSKEFSLRAMSLIKSGLEKGWSDEVLNSIKQDTPNVDLNYIYKINNNLSYTNNELMFIDNTLLTNEHRLNKENYLSCRENIINEIIQMVGEITTSGIREKIKKMQSNEQVRRFSKKCNDYIGHVKPNNIKNKTDDQLINLHKEITQFYDDYQTISLLS